MIWAVLILGLGVGGYWYWTSSKTAAATTHYTTKAVATGDITVIVTAVGTVEPIEQVDVGSLISGTIAEVDVEINDQVTKGQVLARLDTSSLEAELDAGRGPLTASKAEVEDALATQEAAEADAEPGAEDARPRG